MESFQIEIYAKCGKKTPVQIIRGFNGRDYAVKEAARILKQYDAVHSHRAEVVVCPVDALGRPNPHYFTKR